MVSSLTFLVHYAGRGTRAAPLIRSVPAALARTDAGIVWRQTISVKVWRATAVIEEMASGGDHADRQGLEAVGEVGPDSAWLAGQLEPGHPPGQRRQHDA